MRNVEPYECPRCGAESLGAAVCNRCQIPVVDAEGHPLVAPPERRYRLITKSEALLTIVGGAVMLMIPGGIALVTDRQRDKLAVIAVVFAIAVLLNAAWHLVPGALGLRRYRARAAATQRMIDAAGVVTPIASAEGVARIRGRVRVMDGVDSPAGEDGEMGALLIRERKDVEIGGRTIAVAADASRCGRFVVTDETGVAVVDDDAFELWAKGGVPVGKSLLLAVRAGDEVEVAGPTRRGSAPDALEGAKQAAYRQGADEVLLFDGNGEQRVIVVVDEPILKDVGSRAVS